MTSYDEVISWATQLTKDISRKKYGRNRENINEGIEDQKRNSIEIKKWEDKGRAVLNRLNDYEKNNFFLKTFDALKKINAKKIHCLQTMIGVASLEENCSRLSHECDVRSVSLSKASQTCHSAPEEEQANENISGFIATSSQDCIFGLRDNWDWVLDLVKCSNVHLKNGADYHKFFHEIEESDAWLRDDLKKFSKIFETYDMKGDEEDAQQISNEVDAVYIALRQWEAKTNRLWSEATKLVPVPLRTDGVKGPTPAIILCDYETTSISVRAGEEVLLLNNSKPHIWKVRNGKGEEAEVPALIVLIPGPDKTCMEAAEKLRFQLLTTWTNLLKRIGVRLICYMLTMFKPEYNTQEISELTSMEDIDKDHLLGILSTIEDTLKKYWADHEGFMSLQERILSLRMILEEFGDGAMRGEDSHRCLVLKITTLGQIMKLYQDMFKDWEKFKVSVEVSRAPELMLIVDKWEQLQFVTREYFSKFWKIKLPLNDQEKTLMNARMFTLDGINFEDTVDLGLTTPKTDSAKETVEKERSNLETSVKVIKVTTVGDNARAGENLFNGGSGNSSSTIILNKNDRFKTIEFTVNLNKGGVEEVRTQEMITKMLGNPTPVYEEGFDEMRTVTTTTTTSSSGGTNLGGDRRTSEEGFDETRTRITTTGSARSGNLDGDRRTSEEGFDEKRVRVINMGSSRGGSLEGDRRTSEEGFDETRTHMTIMKMLGNAEDKLERFDEDGFDETRTVTTSTFGATEKSSRNARPVTKVCLGHSSSLEVNEGVFEDGFEELAYDDNTTPRTGRLTSSEYEGTDFGIATETKTAETEQLSSAEMEERKTFSIRSVVNPIDKTEISLQQAIMLGVIRPNEGIYVNSVTGEAVPIATAMADGLIKVMFTTTKRSPEKLSSIGIITVKTVREVARPYIVLSVKDTRTGEEIEQREAHDRHILNERQGVYTDPKTGKNMLIMEAADLGLVKIEYSGDPVPEPEVICKTYAVRAVVDRRLKKTVTFHEAVKRGLIDKESGAFRDTISGEKMYVGDAIMRGFLKARLIEDASGLNIDPENKMLIDKTQKIRERLLKPLKVISAFKLAAKEGAKK